MIGDFKGNLDKKFFTDIEFEGKKLDAYKIFRIKIKFTDDDFIEVRENKYLDFLDRVTNLVKEIKFEGKNIDYEVKVEKINFSQRVRITIRPKSKSNLKYVRIAAQPI